MEAVERGLTHTSAAGEAGTLARDIGGWALQPRGPPSYDPRRPPKQTTCWIRPTFHTTSELARVTSRVLTSLVIAPLPIYDFPSTLSIQFYLHLSSECCYIGLSPVMPSLRFQSALFVSSIPNTLDLVFLLLLLLRTTIITVTWYCEHSTVPRLTCCTF